MLVLDFELDDPKSVVDDIEVVVDVEDAADPDETDEEFDVTESGELGLDATNLDEDG